MVMYLLLTMGWIAAWLTAIEQQRSQSSIARHPRRRRFVQIAMLVLAASFAVTAVHQVETHQRAIAIWLGRWSRYWDGRAGGGFANQVSLGTISARLRQDEQRIALVVAADREPGYLRAMAYHNYLGGVWLVDRNRSTTWTSDDSRFVFAGSLATQTPAMTVYSAPSFRTTFFLPLAVAAVDSACHELTVFPGKILRPLDHATSPSYDIYLDQRARPDTDEPRYCLALPQQPELLAALDALLQAARIEQGATLATASERLEQYFAREYRYTLDFVREQETDPLVSFLSDPKRSGHCELFASTGTLALRRLGFPARYVTGLLCAEQTRYDRTLWLARNRHAHAWIEAYDPQRGWLTVELTPPAGLPHALPREGLEALTEALALWSRHGSRWIWRRLPELPGLALQLVRTVGTALWVNQLSLLSALAIFVGWWWWRLHRKPQQADHEPLPAALAAARRSYLQLERRLARYGLARGPAETLHAYASRMARVRVIRRGLGDPLMVAERIRSFADLRYTPRAPFVPRASGPER
jgi:transglutaminase-like putative cysteine protease